MKYVAFRVVLQAWWRGRLQDGHFVQAQRSSDLNWSTLAKVESVEEAVDFIRPLRSDPLRQPVYGPAGYTMEI